MMAPWPPQLIFNTDGHWVINYQDRWAVEDIDKMIPVLADCGVDALTALVGIDDDQKVLMDKIPPVEGARPEEKDSNAAHADKLSKRYPLEGGGSVQAVRETSVGVPPNTVLGLLGPNGSTNENFEGSRVSF